MLARLKLFTQRLVSYFSVPRLVFWLLLPFGIAVMVLGIGRVSHPIPWALLPLR